MLFMGETAIREALLVFFNIYYFILLGRIILTFFMRMSRTTPVVEEIYGFLWILTEPVLKPIRNVLPPVSMGAGYLDLSPLVLLILLSIIRSVILF